jgi:hypothetical protein
MVWYISKDKCFNVVIPQVTYLDPLQLASYTWEENTVYKIRYFFVFAKKSYNFFLQSYSKSGTNSSPKRNINSLTNSGSPWG